MTTTNHIDETWALNFDFLEPFRVREERLRCDSCGERHYLTPSGFGVCIACDRKLVPLNRREQFGLRQCGRMIERAE